MELLQRHPAVVPITAAIQEWLWNVPGRGMRSLSQQVCSSWSYWGFPAASLARDAFTASQTLPWPLAPALYSNPSPAAWSPRVFCPAGNSGAVRCCSRAPWGSPFEVLHWGMCVSREVLLLGGQLGWTISELSSALGDSAIRSQQIFLTICFPCSVLGFSAGLKERYLSVGLETGSCGAARTLFAGGHGQVHLMPFVSSFLFTARRKLIPAL